VRSSRGTLARTALCFAVFLYLVTIAAVAQTPEFEGRTIADIQFPNGQPLDPSDLARVLPFKKGEPLRAADVSQAIDALYATGRFTNIVVDGELSGTGVIVRFITENALFLGGINVQGKILDDPNRAQVTSAAQLSLGAEFHDEDVTQALDRINRLLKANGFYEAKITPEVDRGSDAQEIFLTFKVHEGKRAKYEMPLISGTTKLPDATIVRATGWRFPLIHWWKHVSSSRTQAGLQGVQKKYGGKDRLMAHVELKNLDYHAEHRRVQAHLDIDAGPKVKIKAVETKVSRRVLKRYVPVFQQRAVDDDLLETGRRNLVDYFQSKGYYDVDVDFRTQPIVNDEETVEYAISRGMRYKLVSVAIAGNHYFDSESLRERMFMQPAHRLLLRHGRYSEVFRKRDEQTIKELYTSNGFRDVKVTSEVMKDMKGNAGDIGVTMHIDEGSQWVVDHLTVNGAPEISSSLTILASSEVHPFSEVNVANDS
jgi:outer membrane protein insertion porin family